MQFDEKRWREDDQHIFHYIAGDASLWMRRYEDFSAVPAEVLEQLGTPEFLVAIPIENMAEIPIVKEGILDLEQLLRDGYAVTRLSPERPFQEIVIGRDGRPSRRRGHDH